jgi:hypothetical protein
MKRPPLTIEQILAWADDHHAHTGEWPRIFSGPVRLNPNETWRRVDNALRYGLRNLPSGGDSLARLLARERGYRNVQALPPLTVTQVLAWADAHHERTGFWPGAESGAVPEAPGETWAAVEHALKGGLRGLPPGGSLHQLLRDHRGKPRVQQRRRTTRQDEGAEEE